jgi:hypothetical protein
MWMGRVDSREGQDGSDNQETVSEKYPSAETLVFAVERKAKTKTSGCAVLKGDAYQQPTCTCRTTAEQSYLQQLTLSKKYFLPVLSSPAPGWSMR